MASTILSTPRKRRRREKIESCDQAYTDFAKQLDKDKGLISDVIRTRLEELDKITDRTAARQAQRQEHALLISVLKQADKIQAAFHQMKLLLRDGRVHDKENGTTTADTTTMTDEANGNGEAPAEKECHTCSPQIVYTADEERVTKRLMEQMISEMEACNMTVFSVPVSCLPPDHQQLQQQPVTGNLMEFSPTCNSSSPVLLNCTSSTNGHVQTPAAEREVQPTVSVAAESTKTLNTLLNGPVSTTLTGSPDPLKFTPWGLAECRDFVMNMHPVVSDGDEFPGTLTYYKSAGEFYMMYKMESASELCWRVQSSCNRMTAKKVKLPPDQCVIGFVVCAKYSADGAWYRAEITDMYPDCVEVFFIDYGNKDVVSRSDLLPLENEVRSILIQCICCVLNEYNENNASHSLISKNLMLTLNVVTDVTVKVVRKKKMGEFATMPRYAVDLRVKAEDDEVHDAFTLCRTSYVSHK